MLGVKLSGLWIATGLGNQVSGRRVPCVEGSVCRSRRASGGSGSRPSTRRSCCARRHLCAEVAERYPHKACDDPQVVHLVSRPVTATLDIHRSISSCPIPYQYRCPVSALLSANVHKRALSAAPKTAHVLRDERLTAHQLHANWLQSPVLMRHNVGACSSSWAACIAPYTPETKCSGMSSEMTSPKA